MANAKEKIKEAAIDLFYKKGYFATTLRDVANHVGIRKASLYYHYPTKEGLLLDILDGVLGDLTADLHAKLEGIEDIEDKMRVALRNHILFHIDRQKEVIISDNELRGLSPENYEAVVKMRDNYERELHALIQEGMETGIWAKGDSKILSFAILTMCTALANWFRPGGRLSKEEIARIYEEFIIAGLKGGSCPVPPPI